MEQYEKNVMDIIIIITLFTELCNKCVCVCVHVYVCVCVCMCVYACCICRYVYYLFDSITYCYVRIFKRIIMLFYY
jgi:hypothetical protein